MPKQNRQVVSAVFDLLVEPNSITRKRLKGRRVRIAVGEFRMVYRADAESIHVLPFGNFMHSVLEALAPFERDLFQQRLAGRHCAGHAVESLPTISNAPVLMNPDIRLVSDRPVEERLARLMDWRVILTGEVHLTLVVQVDDKIIETDDGLGLLGEQLRLLDGDVQVICRRQAVR